MQVVAEAFDTQTLLEVLTKISADVLLLDISLPDGSGLEILQEIKAKYPGLKCIMLTMHQEKQYILQSVKMGADGYLLKDADEQELKEAIEQVHAGGKYYKNKISDMIVESFAAATPEKKLLTDREKQIVKMVADGKITKEIADLLCISVRTVETYRSKIMKKLEVSNSAEMVRLALKKEII